MDGKGFDWSNFPQEALNRVTTLSLNMIIDASSIDFAAEVADISATCGQKPGIIKSLFRELLMEFQTVMKGGKGVGQLETRLISSLDMPQDIASGVCTIWRENQGRISSSLLSKTLKANALVDLDWNFGVTASTSELDRSGSAYLQLKMTVDKGDGTKDIFLELSVDQFYNFLSSMEQCKRFLDMVATSNDS